MKNHKRLLVSQCKYTKTPMSKFECFGHAVKGQCYLYLKPTMVHNFRYRDSYCPVRVFSYIRTN